MALDHFENGHFDKAKSLLSSYSKSGSTIGLAYLEYLNQYSRSSEKYTPPYHSVPAKWIADSGDALSASLAHMTICDINPTPRSKEEFCTTIEEKDAAFKELISLVLMKKCARAAVLLGRLFENHAPLIKTFHNFALFSKKGITSAKTYYPWAYRTLPPFQALSSLPLLIKAHQHIYAPSMTIAALERDYPAYDRYRTDNLGGVPIEQLALQSSQIFKIIKDNRPARQAKYLREFLSPAKLAYTTMLDFQNGTRAAASLLYHYNDSNQQGEAYQYLSGDSIEITRYLYDVCKTLPGKEFRKPIETYHLCLKAQDRELDYTKAHDVLCQIIDKSPDIQAADYHNFATALSIEDQPQTDYRKARIYFQKAIDLSCSIKPPIQLASLYSQGLGGKKDLKKALELLEAPCTKEDPQALFLKGNILRKLHSKSQAAAQHYLRAHKAGYPSQRALLNYAETLTFIKKDKGIEIALNIYKENIAILDSEDQIFHAICCIHKGTPEEYASGLDFLEKNYKTAKGMIIPELMPIKIKAIRTAEAAQEALDLAEELAEYSPSNRPSYLALSALCHLIYKTGSFSDFEETIFTLFELPEDSLVAKSFIFTIASLAFEEYQINYFSRFQARLQHAIDDGDSTPLHLKSVSDQQASATTTAEISTEVPVKEEDHSLEFPEITASDDENDTDDIDKTKDKLPPQTKHTSVAEARPPSPPTTAVSTTTAKAMMTDHLTEAEALEMQLLQLQWAEDRKNKHKVHYKKRQTAESAMARLFTEKECPYIPRYDSIEFFLCLFGKGGKKIHNFTSKDAQQAFATMGCSTWVEGNSFCIEAQDMEDNTHTFSSHIPHGKSINLYSPTNKYLKRFCLSIGLTLEKIEQIIS